MAVRVPHYPSQYIYKTYKFSIYLHKDVLVLNYYKIGYDKALCGNNVFIYLRVNIQIQFFFQLFLERGEKLGDLGERTEQMLMNAESFANASQAIMLRYKDKKWYQF